MTRESKQAVLGSTTALIALATEETAVAQDDRSDAAHLDLSEEARAGLAALSAQRIQRHSRLYVRTQESVRELVDEVAEQTDTPIVEVIEYAILSTYGRDH